MKKSEILRKAKTYLWSGKPDEEVYGLACKQKYICYAIKLITEDTSSEQKGKQLIKWIEGLLGKAGNHSDYDTGDRDCRSLNKWLINVHPEFVRTNERVQKLRHKWVDWMIQYWEAKGE